jgi:HEAT repeat protein
MKFEELEIQHRLATVGVTIDNIYDLVNTKRRYPEAIPILIQLLQEGVVADYRTREGIIRALAVSEAKGLAGSVLIQEFYKIPPEKMMLRWAIGSSIEVVVTNENVNDVLQIVCDKQNGIARQMFVLALGKFDLEIVKKTLIDLLDDDEVVLHALKALRKLRAKGAIPRIRNLSNHSNKTIRQLAVEITKYLSNLQ